MFIRSTRCVLYKFLNPLSISILVHGYRDVEGLFRQRDFCATITSLSIQPQFNYCMQVVVTTCTRTVSLKHFDELCLAFMVLSMVHRN